METVLLIDDEKDVLDFLSVLLGSEGFDVVTASNGDEGVHRFMEKRPSLVITDVKMPKKDGLAVLKEIRKMGSDTDVIVLTGHSDEFSAMACLRLGAYDYLSKPLEDIEILVAAVNRALDKRRLTLENLELKQVLKDVSILDDLTGIYNHRYLHHRLDEEIKRSKRFGSALSVLQVDIEDFKSINAAHNRQTGDRVLKQMAEILMELSRAIDICGRLSGDRFFLILPETPRQGAEKAAQRVLEKVQRTEVSTENERVGMSVKIGGVSLSEGKQAQATELIFRADEALVQAKEKDKNGVFMMEL